jgi:8-oxo-dGTP pyrophosphatase MutT (NUDIX family)
MSDRWMAQAPMLARLAQRLRRVLAPPSRRYLPLRVHDETVGWLTPERARRLAGWHDYFTVSDAAVDCTPSLATAAARTAAFAEVAHKLADDGALTAWRDERYAVAAQPGATALFEIERAAARYFGVHTFAAHANGVVGNPDRWRMWLARRSSTKPIDPGLLDNLVGGGIPSGASVGDTLTREAWEEAGIASLLASEAHRAGAVEIRRDQPDGLQRETIYVHDLWLPAAFVPANQDGEAVEHRLGDPEEVLALTATDDVTADASLVIVDFLLRHGHIAAGDPSFAALDGLRRAAPAGNARQRGPQ